MYGAGVASSGIMTSVKWLFPVALCRLHLKVA